MPLVSGTVANSSGRVLSLSWDVGSDNERLFDDEEASDCIDRERWRLRLDKGCTVSGVNEGELLAGVGRLVFILLEGVLVSVKINMLFSPA
jgi:hypothetical protein